MASDERGIDTRDMVGLHSGFRRALAEAPNQLAGASASDRTVAARLASYLEEMLWLLHAHHEGEDALLYPLLADRLDPHLAQEETALLPIAARNVAPLEWGAMPGHALSQYAGERVWLPFGLALEHMPADVQSAIVENLPPPVAAMWRGGGSDAFAAEMATLRSLAD